MTAPRLTPEQRAATCPTCGNGVAHEEQDDGSWKPFCLLGCFGIDDADEPEAGDKTPLTPADRAACETVERLLRELDSRELWLRDKDEGLPLVSLLWWPNGQCDADTLAAAIERALSARRRPQTPLSQSATEERRPDPLAQRLSLDQPETAPENFVGPTHGDLINLVKAWCHEHGATWHAIGRHNGGWLAEVQLSDGRALRAVGTDHEAVLQALDVGRAT